MLCPVCKKEVKWEGNPYRPFCGERCKLIDLGTWTEEGYRIAGGEADEEYPGKDGADEEG